MFCYSIRPKKSTPIIDCLNDSVLNGQILLFTPKLFYKLIPEYEHYFHMPIRVEIRKHELSNADFEIISNEELQKIKVKNHTLYSNVRLRKFNDRVSHA